MQPLYHFILACSLCIYGTELFGGIADHLRSLPENSSDATIRSIDHIYLINLDERPEKLAHCTSELAPYGIYPQRVPAVNGWKLSFEEIDDLGVRYDPITQPHVMASYYTDGDGLKMHDEMMCRAGRNYFCHKMPRGSIGIVLSHLSILQDAYDRGYETIWVMEDDIVAIRNPHELSDLVERLNNLVGPTGWDILFTDPDTKGQNGGYVKCYSYAERPNFKPNNSGRFAQRIKISCDFSRVGARYGAYSMILSRSGIKKILAFLKQYQCFLPYDMEYTLPNDIQLYTVNYDVVSTQPQALSDNGTPTYGPKN